MSKFLLWVTIMFIVAIPKVSADYDFVKSDKTTEYKKPEEKVLLGYRYVTAYNTVSWQTDSTPCISASGKNVCELNKLGYKTIATNELPFGTIVEIAGKRYVVEDRTHARYERLYDLNFGMNVQRARLFGKQRLAVYVIRENKELTLK